MTDYWNSEVLVLGCGNILFGDDGFGPAAVKYLQENYQIPPLVSVIDVGSGVRGILFNVILGDKRPNRILIVDSVDVGRSPGEIFELDISDIPENKIDDFSMHQLPTSNLLRELSLSGGVEVRIIVAQIQHIPDEVSPGLSETVRDAIPSACEMIFAAIK